MFVSCILLVFAFPLVPGQGIGDLYPFGPSASDSSLSPGNDLSDQLELTVPFNYYEEIFEILYINTNGLISFNTPVTMPQKDRYSNSFPLNPEWDGTFGTDILIAPFWADVDTSNSRGNIYYRQSTDSQLLNSVNSDVRETFILYSDYSAVWAFVATWDDVSFFNHNTASATDPRNTFQLVLTTDGIQSFAFFRYQTIQWECGTTLQGDDETGLTDIPAHNAVVGFNKGDGLTTYNDVFPDEVLDLPTSSNVDVPGLFAYQIDTDMIPAGCDNGVTFYTYPVYGNMFGGEKVYLNGPCWGINQGLKCKFLYNGNELQISNGTQVDRQTAYCVPEPFFMVGEIDLEVSVDDGINWMYTGVYRVVFPSRVTNVGRVTRESSNSDAWSTAGNSLSITWSIDEFETTDVLDAHVLAYREDGSAGPRWEVVYTITTEETNDGSISFTPSAVSEVTEDNAFGLIRIQPSNGGIGRKLYSTEHALGYILEEQYQENPVQWSNDKCIDWSSTDNSAYTSSLLACPCTLDQALADSGRFQPDTGCSMFSGSVCTYHVGAKHCVRSVFASTDHAGTQCCYDVEGSLMYAGDSDQGSTNDRSHVWGSAPYLQADMVPSLSHWKHDVITFYYCCLWGTDCKTYMERRITMDCFDYEPPTQAAMFGDPHIITLDNANFTFNGKGEYTLLEVDSESFRLDGRFEVIPAFSSGVNQQDGATGITAVVMLDDYSDVFNVEKNNLAGLALYRGEHTDLAVTDWERIVFRDQTWLDLPGVSITINNNFESDQMITSLTVMFMESRIGVNVTSEEDQNNLAISVILPPDLKGSSGVRGMLGNYNDDPDDDLRPRSGSVLDPNTASEEEIYEAGLTWETVYPMLFRYSGGKTHADYQNSTVYNPVLVAPDESSLSSSEQSTMENTCGDVEQCRFDYLVTRDQDLASSTATVVEHYYWADDVMMKMTSCPFFDTPRNGSKTYSQMENEEVVSNDMNNFVGTTVMIECGEGSVLVGSPERTCQENGEYSGSENPTDCIFSPCGSLPALENGYMSYSTLEETQIIIVTCDDGYKLEGASRHECSGDAWSGSTSSCVDDKNGGKIAGIVIGSIIGAALLIVLVILAILYLPKYLKTPQKNKPKTARPVYYDAENPNSPQSITQVSVHTAGYNNQPGELKSTGAPSVRSNLAPSVKSTGAHSTRSNVYQPSHKDDMSSLPSSGNGNDETDRNEL